MRLRLPLPAVKGDTPHIVGVGVNRIGKEQWTSALFQLALLDQIPLNA